MNTLIRFRYKRKLRKFKAIRDAFEVYGFTYTKRQLLQDVYLDHLFKIYKLKEI